ncbi:MAG TPA: nucleotidyl transferase AbiEii/AbiGii toxin family protein [Xanthobacteraceae bacterium]|nr:nucleotidyl transferase AbiEii/AbiGii toxin family protein [Xanthobacteraceae bacterium]
MPRHFDPQLDILPAAQQEIWEQLRPAPGLSFVLYGGTAVALHFAHRQSVDFDFFRTEPLDKDEVRRAFAFMDKAEVIQDSPETLAALARMPSGPVRVSFFGRIRFGRLNDPEWTSDDVLLVASLDDLLATKLKATQDRADAKDYRDIAELLRAGVSLARALSAFRSMFKGEPAEVLRALGYFDDGDLSSLDKADRALLLDVRDQIRDLPPVRLMPGLLAGET